MQSLWAIRNLTSVQCLASPPSYLKCPFLGPSIFELFARNPTCVGHQESTSQRLKSEATPSETDHILALLTYQTHAFRLQAVHLLLCKMQASQRLIRVGRRACEWTRRGDKIRANTAGTARHITTEATKKETRTDRHPSLKLGP